MGGIYKTILFSQVPYEVASIIIHIFHIRTLRHREVNTFSLSHTHPLRSLKRCIWLNLQDLLWCGRWSPWEPSLHFFSNPQCHLANLLQFLEQEISSQVHHYFHLPVSLNYPWKCKDTISYGFLCHWTYQLNYKLPIYLFWGKKLSSSLYQTP